MDSVIVLGGGYGGFKVAKALDDVADVTLVDPTDAFMHNVAAWRALVEPSWLERIFMPYDRLLHRGTFIRDRAVAVDGTEVTLESGAKLTADHVILATGSSYPFPAKVDESDTAQAQSLMRAAHDALRAADRALIIGAGPSGLELAGEIKAFFPDKHVIVVDAADDVLTGPYDQELRDELRRQLDELGVELRLSSPLRGLPEAAPATAADVSVELMTGETLEAGIWFRAFGVKPATDYLRGTLEGARDANGYIHVDEYLRVAGHENVYALGDISDADRNMAGMAGFQAELLAGNLRAQITGEGERTAYAAWPPVIAVPLGPDGGAGQLPGTDGVAGPDVVSEIKGRAMIVEPNAALFDAPAKVA